MPKWVFVVVHNRVIAIVEPKKRKFYFHNATLCLVDLSQTISFIFVPYNCSYGGDFFLDQTALYSAVLLSLALQVALYG